MNIKMLAVRTAMRPALILLHSVTYATASATASATVRLAGGKARLFKSGHPLVFGGAVGAVQGSPGAGDVVDVVDGKDNLVGWGVYNPASMYRVRLLAAAHEKALVGHRDLKVLIRHRLAAAAALRSACDLPSTSTSAYRLVNSEGDRLSGLTVDVFDGTAVAVTSAIWLEQRSEMVMEALAELPGIQEVVWRRSDGRLQQDGWQPAAKPQHAGPSVHNDDSPAALPSPPKPPPPPPVRVLESGLTYLVAPSLGQKSGFYCDQRDNRRMLSELCAGKRVLDLFCYSGGFSISAARGGAASCVGVDSSAPALELARQNADLNGHGGTCEFVRADVTKYLRGLLEEGLESDADKREPAERFDVIICDPPKLAPSVKDLPRATNKYRKLNGLAMRAIHRRGGLLLTCSCSAAMTQSGGFIKMLTEAAQAEGRTVTVLTVRGAATDHVINPACPESEYLTAVLAHVV